MSRPVLLSIHFGIYIFAMIIAFIIQYKKFKNVTIGDQQSADGIIVMNNVDGSEIHSFVDSENR